MNPEFKLRTGKYAGKTYAWVNKNNPRYIAWVKENQPKMLIEREVAKTTVKVVEVNNNGREPFKLQLNENFDNEPADEGCIPYMLEHEEQYKEQLALFKKHYKARYRILKEEYKNG